MTDLIGVHGSLITPGFGPCCACEGDIKHQPRLMMLEFEAPAGFIGWGCLPCGLIPGRGAIAVFCKDCVEAQKLPEFIAAGKNLTSNLRVRLDDKFVQKPYLHSNPACPNSRFSQILLRR